MKGNSVEVKLLGQRLVLKSDADADYIRQVVDFANVRLEEAARRVKHQASHQVALLALLDLSEEYLNSKKRVESHQKKVTEQAQGLRSMIDAEFPESKVE